MPKFVVVLGAVVALILTGVGSASAQDYPGDATLTCTPSTVAIGDDLSCTATGYEPGGTVTFQINPFLGSAVADANGVASVTAPVPTGVPTGPVTVSSSGPGADGGSTELVLNTTVTVIAAAAQPAQAADGLPVTGSDSSLPLAQIAVVLIAAGGLALLVARRRSNKPAEVSV